MPSYPGREQEPLLNQLLRKKLAPDVADWVDDGEKAGRELAGSKAAEWRELWTWAAIKGNELARSHEWGADDEEEAEEEDEDDDGDSGDKMEGVEKDGANEDVPSLGAEVWMRFLSKGELPK